LVGFLKEVKTGGFLHDSKLEVLDAIAGLVPLLENPEKHLNSFARLLGPAASEVGLRVAHTAGGGPSAKDENERSFRGKIVNIYRLISENPACAAFAPIAALLEKLNAFQQRTLMEVDTEARLDAFEILDESFLEQYLRKQAPLLVPVLQQLLYDMHSHDFTIRAPASSAIIRFIKCAGNMLEGEEEALTKHVLRMLTTVLMPALKSSIKSQSEVSRRGFVQVLAFMATRFQGLKCCDGRLEQHVVVLAELCCCCAYVRPVLSPLLLT
jgi:hypothetical protein